MKTTSLVRSIAPALLVAITAAAAARAQHQAGTTNPDGVVETARQAYIYGYPLVTMYVTKRVMTNVATPQPTGKAPINQFGSLFAFPTSAFREVVAPNVNTLY